MSNVQNRLLTWVEISRLATQHNIKLLRKLIGPKVILAPCVKANAYGHSLVDFSKLISGGADWLAVNSLSEAEALRKAKIKSPLYILGYVPQSQLPDAVRLGCRMVVYNRETVRWLAAACKKVKKRARIHLKVETGNNRQGILINEVVDFAKYVNQFPAIEIEGISTHFANIEDTTDDSYAQFQLENFRHVLENLAREGIHIPLPHCANSAATILFSETHFSLVRPGIAIYGLWPSAEVKQVAQKKNKLISLRPVLSWKTRIAQIKEVPRGGYIGYGCTYQAKRRTRLAILPVGYYDGYDRGLSNKSYVLIHGKRAPVRGRVCMNIIMVDVTDIPHARLEDPVTLLGASGREEISADALAEMADTINYEITTRIRESITRVVVD